MDFVMWLATGTLVTFGVIYVHEMGHYLYGQLFVGIPGRPDQDGAQGLAAARAARVRRAVPEPRRPRLHRRLPPPRPRSRAGGAVHCIGLSAAGGRHLRRRRESSAMKYLPTSCSGRCSEASDVSGVGELWARGMTPPRPAALPAEGDHLD